MAQKKYQVFISSTYTDLIEERKKVQEILLMADCIPAGMEAFVATTEEQFEIIKKVIDLCDYYVLILGKRYGSINSANGTSYTEMEYDYAVSKGIPVLVFALDDSVKVPADKEDTEAKKIDKLAAFKSKVMNNRLASIWKDVGDLAGKVAISIMKAKQEIIRSGWIRGDETIPENLSKIIKLQDKNRALEERILQLENEIQNAKMIDNLAFENYDVEICYDKDQPYSMPKRSTLKEIYADISLGIGEYDVREQYLIELVAKSVGFVNSKYADKITIKRIINQYVILGFIYEWIDESDGALYRLTEKGKKVKDEINAFKIYKKGK